MVDNFDVEQSDWSEDWQDQRDWNGTAPLVHKERRVAAAGEAQMALPAGETAANTHTSSTPAATAVGGGAAAESAESGWLTSTDFMESYSLPTSVAALGGAAIAFASNYDFTSAGRELLEQVCVIIVVALV